MHEYIELYNELLSNLKKIEEKFLKPHLEDRLSTPEEYEEDVKAFCILSHALFENYFEQVALMVLEKSTTQWIEEKKLSTPLLTLLSYSNTRFDLLKDQEPYQSVYDRLKKVIEDAKKQLSKEIYNNHGASEKYLRKILCPVSIDVPQDPTIINSLQKLANARGDYAHKHIKKTINPEDAKLYVSDCIRLSEDIKHRAIVIFYEQEYKTLIAQKLCDVLRNVIAKKEN
ncbi:HEPN domain-containing protein [Parageobacillus toebii]|uniref:HEPN domain-containing protein n=1 Tax=Parageobacillus toebii TaxID=153151 RepID=UPI002815C6AA|nr:HEPN domain-containing protein [Parageobacillus toebii]WMT18166.1 HEPN domain-containing protein [Parageobacillus toebii]